MEYTWLYSLCQCLLSVSLIVVSVRLCMAGGGSGSGEVAQDGPQGSMQYRGSVSSCLRLCLGWVGALGGTLEVPVFVLLNLQSPQCMYTCITLVCCPLLARQFTMCLLLLLSLDAHLQQRLADRYSSLVTRRRALCAVSLCWVGSVLSCLTQFIGSDMLDTWGADGTGQGGGTAGLGLVNNLTSSSPPPSTPPHPKYPQSYLVIGENLPYGGFLSKFYMEDLRNFTYAEIHGSHWGVCGPGTIFSPLVYVNGITAFLLPFLGLLAIYLDLLCLKNRPQVPFYLTEPPKGGRSQAHFLALSLLLLALLCLPLHITHLLLLVTTDSRTPIWAYSVATFLSQLYSLVPPLLFTPAVKQLGGQRASFSLGPRHVPAGVAPSRSKAVGRALREVVWGAPWCKAKNSLKAKVSPGLEHNIAERIVTVLVNVKCVN